MPSTRRRTLFNSVQGVATKTDIYGFGLGCSFGHFGFQPHLDRAGELLFGLGLEDYNLGCGRLFGLLCSVCCLNEQQGEDKKQDAWHGYSPEELRQGLGNLRIPVLETGINYGMFLETARPYSRRSRCCSPHMILAWTGTGRSVPRIVPRGGSVVHREVVEKLAS